MSNFTKPTSKTNLPFYRYDLLSASHFGRNHTSSTDGILEPQFQNEKNVNWYLFEKWLINECKNSPFKLSALNKLIGAHLVIPKFRNWVFSPHLLTSCLLVLSYWNYGYDVPLIDFCLSRSSPSIPEWHYCDYIRLLSFHAHS